MNREEALRELKLLSDPQHLQGMGRFAINDEKAYGVPVPKLRALAKRIGTSHELALELWESGVHEARILAGMIDDPQQVTEEQMEDWAADFDSWDLCDQCCGNLFEKTELAYAKAAEWSRREEEWVKRAAFALMASLAVHDKAAADPRNFVKKAVNWALRQIGKRNPHLHGEAVEAANAIKQQDAAAAKWIASDALRELTSGKVIDRIKGKKG